MSENLLMNEKNEVHYIYGDQEYVIGDEVNAELRELICDGSRAILVDGQYVLTDNQTILLQGDNLTQYYINDDSNFVVDEDSKLFENSEYVQLVEDDTNDGQEIIFYTNDQDKKYVTTENQLVEEIEGLQDEDGNVYPVKRIKLEGQTLSYEDFEQTEMTDDSVQYAILDDSSTSESAIEQNHEKTEIDLSKITGRNLITGQTVTLHSYMEKLKNRMNKNPSKKSKRIYEDVSSTTWNKETSNSELSGLLDRKISIGKTKTGKKIVGKIIHVEKKYKKDNITESDNELKNLAQKCAVSPEGFEQICKTLGGVMEMESVQKKLEHRNLIVKLVEKKFLSLEDSYQKNVSYSYGYMEKEVEEINGENVEKWKFVQDQDTQEVIMGLDEETFSPETKTAKYPSTTSLTILVTYEKGGNRTVRVNLNATIFCTICGQQFTNQQQLRQHMLQAHSSSFDESKKLFSCSVCDKTFTTHFKCQKHELTHSSWQCDICKVFFSTKLALRKHHLSHIGLKTLTCDVCNKLFATKFDLSVHKKIHFPEKLFACNVCSRTFSRHSNLLRHAEIHKGSGVVYKCDICCCSYNFMSSLTRHMVRSHLVATDLKK